MDAIPDKKSCFHTDTAQPSSKTYQLKRAAVEILRGSPLLIAAWASTWLLAYASNWANNL